MTAGQRTGHHALAGKRHSFTIDGLSFLRVGTAGIPQEDLLLSVRQSRTGSVSVSVSDIGSPTTTFLRFGITRVLDSMPNCRPRRPIATRKTTAPAVRLL